MSDYLVGLESSGWLRHIKAVVDAAVFLTKVISFALIVARSTNIFINWLEYIFQMSEAPLSFYTRLYI